MRKSLAVPLVLVNALAVAPGCVRVKDQPAADWPGPPEARPQKRPEELAVFASSTLGLGAGPYADGPLAVAMALTLSAADERAAVNPEPAPLAHAVQGGSHSGGGSRYFYYHYFYSRPYYPYYHGGGSSGGASSVRPGTYSGGAAVARGGFGRSGTAAS
jgi:hypothetical protein